MPTIGALVIGNISPEEFWREFRQGLRDLGFIEGQNIRFEFRSAEGQIDRLPELAAGLVRLKVDVIVTWFSRDRTKKSDSGAISRGPFR
jgi:putative ABC transport system substrate-binding protein